TTPDEEQARIADLVASPKDRAENVMIVDLLRNDLGRVCAYGTVRVPKVCQVETYKYVHHLVSEVRGRLAPGKTPLDLLRACFPGGSVTGAPKGPRVEPDWSRSLLRPFPTSQTYRNLKARREGVLHVTDDVLLLAKAAVGQAPPQETRPAERVSGFVLTGACRFYEFVARS